jgi:hypothetical protein
MNFPGTFSYPIGRNGRPQSRFEDCHPFAVGMLPRVKRMWIVIAWLLLLAAAGCSSVRDGGDGASAAATQMLQAVAGEDGVTACGLLAPDTVSELEESAGQPCPEAILDEDLPEPGAVTGTTVYGQWAQVRLSGDTVFLGAFPGGWRVVAAGCTPQGDQPYECTLQGG